MCERFHIMSYAKREGVVRYPIPPCDLINYPGLLVPELLSHAKVRPNRTSDGGLRRRPGLSDAAPRFDRRRNLSLRRGILVLARRRRAPTRGRAAAHPGDLRLGPTPAARAPAARHRRLERSRRLHDRRADSRPSRHPRAPPAVLYPPAVPGLPPADCLPAVALGPPVVRRTGGALPRRVRRAGAHHSGSRRSHQLRRARRFRSLVVRLRGLEILAHPHCAPLADALARHAFRGARQVHIAAADGRRIRLGPMEGPAPSGCRRHPVDALHRNPGRFAVSSTTCSANRNPSVQRRGCSRLGAAGSATARPSALAAPVRARAALHRRQPAGRRIYGIYVGPQNPRPGSALLPARLGGQISHPPPIAHRWPDWRPSSSGFASARRARPICWCGGRRHSFSHRPPYRPSTSAFATCCPSCRY